MIIKKIPVGMIGTNCYLVACPETKEAAVIDPGDDVDLIMKAAEDNEWKIKYIINTHGHWDHVGGNQELKSVTDAPILIHEQDQNVLEDPNLNLGSFFGLSGTKEYADQLLKEGDLIAIGNIQLKVIHTPGHTPGGIALLGKEDLFAGDTLFYGSIGRTDLPGGDFDQIIQSIKEKLLVLDDKIRVYPGHGPGTTIRHEREENPFLK